MNNTVKVANFQIPKVSQPSKLADAAFVLMIGLGFGSLSMYAYMAKHPQDILHAQPHAIIELQTGSNATEQAKPATKSRVVHWQQI